MKILICPDSFKNSLSAFEVATCMEKGIRKVWPKADVLKMPLCDGGEGTLEMLMALKNGKWIEKSVTGPLNNKINGRYGILEDQTAIIEMARVSGLECIPKSKQNPMKTSTWGVGELIKDALDHGCKRIIITLGGSATNDGGLGMAKALGFKFLDEKRQVLIGVGGDLENIVRIDESEVDQRIYNCDFEVLCDVNNPLYGPNGAAYVYAKQKGATQEMIQKLDIGLRHYSQIIKRKFSKDFSRVPGAGAAGGLAAGIMAFLNGKLFPGFDKISELIKLECYIESSDIIITGEGFLDRQTLNGKVVYGVSKKASLYNKPVIAVVGGHTLDEDLIKKIGIQSIFSILNETMNEEEALDKNNARKRIELTTIQIAKLLSVSKNSLDE